VLVGQAWNGSPRKECASRYACARICLCDPVFLLQVGANFAVLGSGANDIEVVTPAGNQLERVQTIASGGTETANARVREALAIVAIGVGSGNGGCHALLALSRRLGFDESQGILCFTANLQIVATEKGLECRNGRPGFRAQLAEFPSGEQADFVRTPLRQFHQDRNGISLPVYEWLGVRDNILNITRR